MNAIKMFNLTSRPRFISSGNRIPLRHISFSTELNAEEKVKELPPVVNILDELREPELTEEDIMKIRFKARLPERIYKKFVVKEPVPIEAKYDFQMHRLQSYYARFGIESKLNPGICWPTKEEMLNIIEDDKIFEPPLNERINRIESARLAEENRKREVEAEVDKNMGNLDKWIKEYYDKIEKKNIKGNQLKMEREKLVEEISEYLGYDIDPRDPRFKEAVDQKNKEKKKALKVKKQQESYDKMLEKLKKIAETN